MNKENYAVYEKVPAHGSIKNGLILGPFNSKKEAQSAAEKWGYNGDNYYINNTNNERYQEIIDEAYGNYLNYPLATIHDHRTNILYKNIGKGWCMLNGRSMASPHPTRHLTQEEFISKCKTDPEFSEKWGLKIEERELSLEERSKIWNETHNPVGNIYTHNQYNENEIPSIVITVTYKDEKIEVYE